MSNFATLTSKHHEPSSVSQIIPRSVLQGLSKDQKELRDTNSLFREKLSTKSSSSLDEKRTADNFERLSTYNAASSGNIDNQGKQRYYKRNLVGEIVSLQIDNETITNARLSTPDDYFFLHDTEENSHVGHSFHTNDAFYRRRKNMLLHREKVLRDEKKERMADVLVNELVSKTPAYQSLLTSNVQKSNEKDTNKTKNQMDKIAGEDATKNNAIGATGIDTKIVETSKAAEEIKKNENTEKNNKESNINKDNNDNGDKNDEEEDTHNLLNRPEQILPKLRLTQQKRLFLERQRQYQEAMIPNKYHPIQLEDWNSQINWEGCASPSSCTTGEGKSKPLAKVVSPNHPSNVIAAPPLDPHEILSQARNPELDALNLMSRDASIGTEMEIMWEGAAKTPSSFQPAKLILHESEAGSSIAHLALPMKRPVPFHQSLPYHKRCQLLRRSGKKSSADSFIMHSDQNKEFEQKQKKRSLLENEKKQRVSLALGALDLGGGKGRTITSSLMGPGGTERTGRPSRHENSSSAHDAENVEQLELGTSDQPNFLFCRIFLYDY